MLRVGDEKLFGQISLTSSFMNELMLSWAYQMPPLYRLHDVAGHLPDIDTMLIQNTGQSLAEHFDDAIIRRILPRTPSPDPSTGGPAFETLLSLDPDTFSEAMADSPPTGLRILDDGKVQLLCNIRLDIRDSSGESLRYLYLTFEAIVEMKEIEEGGSKAMQIWLSSLRVSQFKAFGLSPWQEELEGVADAKANLNV